MAYAYNVKYEPIGTAALYEGTRYNSSELTGYNFHHEDASGPTASHIALSQIPPKRISSLIHGMKEPMLSEQNPQQDIKFDYLESNEGFSKKTYVGTTQTPSAWNETTHEGRPWQTGPWKRFPTVSFCSLLAVIALCIGSIAVLLISDHKDVNLWCSGRVKIYHVERSFQMTVSVWISLITLVAGKLLSIVFAQGIAVSWWVGAMKGKTIRQLHHEWAVGQSVAMAISKPRLISWVFIGSVAYAAVSALNTVLQKASTATTVPSTYSSNMTASLAGAIPAGYSGYFGATGHDVFNVDYLSPQFIQVIQNYTRKTPILIDVGGCPPTSNVSCATFLNGIGFNYSCSAEIGSLAQPIRPESTVIEPLQSVFQTQFSWDYTAPWKIDMLAFWKCKKDPSGDVIAKRNCNLVPALVQYPVNVSAAPSTTEERQLLVDKVIKQLPQPELDSIILKDFYSDVGFRTTLGGFWFAFNTLFNSSITTKYDVTNAGGDLGFTGSFALPFAVFPDGISSEVLVKNVYESPMEQLLAEVGEIMFRTSVSVVQQNVTDFAWNAEFNNLTLTSHCPNLTSTTAGTYKIYHTVYKTPVVPLVIAIGLMCLIICAILSLFWGYWRLGRKVSLSPLEIAKALHQPTNIESSGGRQHFSVLDVNMRAQSGERLVGSNYNSEDLVDLLGEIKVRYGEVDPNVIGLGPFENTGILRGGSTYY